MLHSDLQLHFIRFGDLTSRREEIKTDDTNGALIETDGGLIKTDGGLMKDCSYRIKKEVG